MKIKKGMAPKTVSVISLVAVCLFCLMLIRTGAVSAQTSRDPNQFSRKISQISDQQQSVA